MKLKNIIEKLESFAPLSLCEDWDNAGLMIGGNDREIKSAAVVLDVTQKAVDFAVFQGCDLIVSHHPFIMPKLTEINFDTKKGELMEKLIKNNVCVYSMHTNFDAAVSGVNDTLIELLDAENLSKDETCVLKKARLKEETTLEGFIEKVKKTLNISHVTYCGSFTKKVSEIAVCGGAGGSLISECLDCDALLTGEAKYHEYQQAAESGIAVVSGGHFETENITLYKIRELLTNLGIDVKDGEIHESFCKII